MTLCIVTKHHCNCQPDEGVFCPDYKPDWYVQCLMDAITEMRSGYVSREAVIEECARRADAEADRWWTFPDGREASRNVASAIRALKGKKTGATLPDPTDEQVEFWLEHTCRPGWIARTLGLPILEVVRRTIYRFRDDLRLGLSPSEWVNRAEELPAKVEKRHSKNGGRRKAITRTA